MVKNRLGLMTIGIYMILIGLLGIYSNLQQVLPIFLKIPNFLIMLLYALAGIYLMKFKNWARQTAIIFAGLFVVLAVASQRMIQVYSNKSLFASHSFSQMPSSNFILMVITQILIIFYLTRLEVREQFR